MADETPLKASSPDVIAMRKDEYAALVADSVRFQEMTRAAQAAKPAPAAPVQAGGPTIIVDPREQPKAATSEQSKANNPAASGREGQQTQDGKAENWWPLAAVVVAALLFVGYGLEHEWFKASSSDSLYTNVYTNPRSATPASRYTAPAVNPNRARQWSACNEQAAKRRALGLDSRPFWHSPNGCTAPGGLVESGAL